MLTSLKIKTWASGPGLLPEGGASVATPASVDPLHFFLVQDAVTIEEAKQSKDFNNFFIRNIEVLSRVARDAEKAIAAGAGFSHAGHGHRSHGAGGGRQFQQQHGGQAPAATNNAWRR